MDNAQTHVSVKRQERVLGSISSSSPGAGFREIGRITTSSAFHQPNLYEGQEEVSRIYTDPGEGDGEPCLSGSLKLLSTAQRAHTVSLSQPPSFVNPLVSLESSQKCCTTHFSQDSACSSQHRPLYQM
ncbi:unnamed protein product [Leuciscus chuanchicus]